MPDGWVVANSHRALQRGGLFESRHSFVLPNRPAAYLAKTGIAMLPYMLRVPYVRTLLNKLSDSGSSFMPMPAWGGTCFLYFVACDVDND
jgi:hypothetical protein